MESNIPIVQASKVSIHQGKMLVLRDVSFSILPSEFVYIIGKTGSGKSSLLKMLYGDVAIADGDASVVGFDLHRLKSKELPLLRRKIGIVFQDFQLLSDRSIDENLRFVLKATGWKSKAKMDYRIAEVLDWVGLKTKGFKFPWELSGGEQQRVVIARALLNEPALILADEPTGNLDPETSTEILKLLRSISEAGTSILMATHELNFLSSFPARTLTVKDGYITEE
ncbi:MAG: ATP-binding cassette domain-containing protein [Bacteroidetes bacterium]|nr:ATP-binding cassette domain-containing protein [Bacteroidota bacterium]